MKLREGWLTALAQVLVTSNKLKTVPVKKQPPVAVISSSQSDHSLSRSSSMSRSRKGSTDKKDRSQSVCLSLSEEDKDYLKKHTSYSEEDLHIWFRSVGSMNCMVIWNNGKHHFRNFKKDCPSGILDKKKVTELYEKKINPDRDSKFLVDQLFRIIDDDNNGGIDFKVSMHLFLDILRLMETVAAGVHGGCEHGGERDQGGEAALDVQVGVKEDTSASLASVCRMYDEDDSGSIELEEMSAVLSNIYQCEGLSQVRTE